MLWYSDEKNWQECSGRPGQLKRACCAVLRDTESMTQGTSSSCECLDITWSFLEAKGTCCPLLHPTVDFIQCHFQCVFQQNNDFEAVLEESRRRQMSAWFAANKTCSDEPRRTCSCFCSKLVQFKSMNQEKIYELLWTFANHWNAKWLSLSRGLVCRSVRRLFGWSWPKPGHRMSLNVFDSQWNMKLFAEFSCFLLYAFAVFVTLGTVKCEEHSISTFLWLSFHHFDRKARRQPLLTHPERAVRRRKTLPGIPCQLSVTRSVVTWCVYDLGSQHKPCRKIVSRKNAAMTMEQSLSFNHSMLYLYTNYLLRNIWNWKHLN